jgi:hypothetical protein
LVRFIDCFLFLFLGSCRPSGSAHIQLLHGAVSSITPIPSRHSFAKEKIALAPNNASAWNYLRGVLNHARLPYSTQAAFAKQYIVDTVEAESEDVLDLENPPPSKGADLPCAAAIEFMADVHEANGKEGVSKAVEVRNHDRNGTVGPHHQSPFGSAVAVIGTHTRYDQKKVRATACERP